MGFKRLFGMGSEDAIADPLSNMGRKELVLIAQKLQSDNTVLSQELSRQHERANEAVRVVSQLYTFLFSLVYAYIDAKAAFAESSPGKSMPAMWLAARILDAFDDLFEKNDLKNLSIGPDPLHIAAMYKIADRKLNPGSKVGDYVGIKETIQDGEQNAEPSASEQPKAED